MNGASTAEGQERADADFAAHFRDQRQLWRERTLRGLLLSTFAACSFAALWFSVISYGIPSVARAANGAVLVIGLMLLARRFLPYAVCAGAFLIALFGACLVSMLRVGFNPNAVLGFGSVTIASALLFGRAVALCAVGTSCLTLFGIGLAHSSGTLLQVPNWPDILDSARLPNGLRVTGIFALLATSSVVGVSYLLERTEHVLLQQVDAARALRQEQLEKEKLRADLALREAALHKARELETLGRLAGSMAHDFNNALLVIWAALDELTERGEAPAVRDAALSALRTAAEQATATTRSLRAFGPSTPRRATVLPLSGVISRAKASLARVLPPNIVIETELSAEGAVAADEGELLRVIANLSLNARDAMRDGGKLLLRVRKVDAAERARAPAGTDWIALEVSDTGTGITEDVKQRLFEPFFTTKELGGTGLGLATVRELARKHGGEVAVVSELGKGTTVTLYWPSAGASSDSLQGPATAGSGAGRVVLLVDDEPAVLAALGRSLTNAGFSVLTAANASLAIELMRRGKLTIHVLCTDWMMPGRPARDLIEEFRRSHAGPVLVCSGHAPAELGIAPDLIDDFLAKPFKGEELVRRIHRLLLEQAPASTAAQS